MRTRLLALMAGGTLLAGCAGPGAAAHEQPPPPVTTPSPPVLSGACLLLDFPRIEQHLGAKLSISGAAVHQKTNTCVARPTDADLPELSISVTPSKADVAVFKDAMLPDGAKAVTGLGRVAYQQTRPAAKGRGPYVEVGWLAGNARLLVLKVTLPVGGDAGALAPEAVELAKEIDRAGV
ncbi:hypothetical protein CS0771_24960 [Catellatospora sp. IY07-71]|uniref:hypothetical protein n=1 Tax=Catellatospora sp. IY07-71 TaxID=2728827 RepID=UPI001BB3BAD9|nr:hypothetical protein [Catellatospora sp. IY07-71]BCJ72952.1 hypothetical protein CS0771_24960 [Catellatospora sp. IY07-71]